MASAFPVTRFFGRASLLTARIIAIGISIALLTVPLTGREFLQFGEEIYGPDAPLMGLNILDFLMQPWLTVVLALGMLTYLYMRFRIIAVERRLVADLSYLLAVTAAMVMLQVAFYHPVLGASSL